MSGPVTDAVVEAALSSQTIDDAGEPVTLLEILDFVDEGEARPIVRAAIEAAIAAMGQAAAPAAPPAEAPLPVTFDALAPRQKIIAETLFCTVAGGADDTLMDMAASIACAQAVAVEHALIDEGMLGGYPLPEHAPAVIRRSMTPEESAILADAMLQGGKLEYLVPAVDLGAGLREAIRIINNVSRGAGVEVENHAEWFIRLLTLADEQHEAALAAERNGGAG